MSRDLIPQQRVVSYIYPDRDDSLEKLQLVFRQTQVETLKERKSDESYYE